MALIDEDKLQGNVIQILQLLKKDRACCDEVATALFAASSIAGEIFFTVSKGGKIIVYDHPGGTVLTPAEYGIISFK